MLKYTQLDIDKVPPRGLIAITGDDESGKSSVGDVLCFALFGRTLSRDATRLAEIIRWGEPRCAAAVDFSLNGSSYQVSRFLDQRGKQGARLDQSGEEEPLATGRAEVGVRLHELIGFGFEEFVESLYIAAPNIIIPPNSASIKKLAGISALESVAQQLERETAKRREDAVRNEHLMSDIEALVKTLDDHEEHLKKLDGDSEKLLGEKDAESKEAASLDLIAVRYQETIPEIRKAAEPVLAASTGGSIRTWKQSVAKLDEGLAAVRRQSGGSEQIEGLITDITTFSDALSERINAIEPLRKLANGYRDTIAGLLGESQRGSDDDSGDTARGSLEDNRVVLRSRAAAASGSRAWASAGMIIALVVAAAAGAAWWLLVKSPEHSLSQQLSTWLGSNAPGWETHLRRWLLPAAGTGAAGFVVLAFRSLMGQRKLGRIRGEIQQLGVRIDRARSEAAALHRLDEAPLPEAVEFLLTCDDAELKAATTAFSDGPGAELLQSELLAIQNEQLKALVVKYEVDIDDEREVLARRAAQLSDDVERKKVELAQLGASIAEERHRHATDGELRSTADEYRKKMQERKRRTQVYKQALTLASGCARHVTEKFNRDMRNLIGETLPRLTQDRYQRLKIDEHRKARVFSTEKNGFVDLETVASGAQRQIMLAVRLALSQELVNTSANGAQFIFLDEPFAFVDDDRARESLKR